MLMEGQVTAAALPGPPVTCAEKKGVRSLVDDVGMGSSDKKSTVPGKR